MRKGRDGGTGGKKTGKKKKRRMKIVATTLLPAVDRLNVDRWNAARSRQYPYLILLKKFLLIFASWAFLHFLHLQINYKSNHPRCVLAGGQSLSPQLANREWKVKT